MDVHGAGGVRLEVLEMDERMVPRMMDQAGGELIKKWCNQRGVGVHTSARVRAVQPEAGGGLRLECEGAPDLSADLVVVATGVKPNVQFLGGSGMKSQRTSKNKEQNFEDNVLI